MRRRGRSRTERVKATNGVMDGDSSSYDGDSNVMMDSDDQENLIQSIQEEVQKTSQLFQGAFFLVGSFAMVVSLFVYPFLCYDECSQQPFLCWIHAIVSCGTHGLSIKLSRSINCCHTGITNDDAVDKCPQPLIFPTFSFLRSKLFVVLVVLNVTPLLLWGTGIFDQDVEHFHLGLVLGNLVTLFGSSLFVWDAQSTRQALSDLNGAKYEHKSL